MTQKIGILKEQEFLVTEKIKVTDTLHQIVSTLRKTKLRSHFVLHKNLGLKIYQFMPNDHLEAVEGD